MKWSLPVRVLCLLALLNWIPSASAAGVKCADFRSYREALAYFKAQKPGYLRLDRDRDGIPCESLPGAPAR